MRIGLVTDRPLEPQAGRGRVSARDRHVAALVAQLRRMGHVVAPGAEDADVHLLVGGPPDGRRPVVARLDLSSAATAPSLQAAGAVVVATSDEARELVARAGGDADACFVVEAGVDYARLPRRRPRDGDGATAVGFLGAGGDAALERVMDAVRAVPSARLVHLDGSNGGRDSQDLDGLAALDVAVCPAAVQEDDPVEPAEAVAAGATLLAFEGTPHAAAVERRGWGTVVPDTADAIREALEDARGDARSARARFPRSIEQEAWELEQVLERVARGAPGRSERGASHDGAASSATAATVEERRAREFVEGARFLWHQRFELIPGVHTLGRNDIDWLLDVANVPRDLTGKSVLDIGTANGGVSFTLERRGASRVVSVDAVDEHKWGYAELRSFLGSKAEFVQSNLYDLQSALGGEKFDVVIFWGVLYHLRHPLLGLDIVRELVGGEGWIETQVADGALGPGVSDLHSAMYYRHDLYGDFSNWFAPTIRALVDWCWSSGLEPKDVVAWPPQRHHRAMVHVVPTEGEPEYVAWEPMLEVRTA